MAAHTEPIHPQLGDQPLLGDHADVGQPDVPPPQALDQGVAPLALVEPKSCKPAVTKEGKKGSLKAQQPEQDLKIATTQGQGAPLSADLPREPCQGAASKKVPKAPKEIQPTKQDMIVFKGLGPLKVQKSGQAKKLSSTARSEPPKTQVKVKGHTGKGQLEKVPEVKIPLKRDGMKKKAKKHVEKGQEDEGPTDKALTLVVSSRRPKLQVKGAKQSRVGCTTSTIVTPYVEVINGGKLVRICRAEPPCASRNTLMEKRSRMIQHLKKVHGLDVFIPQRLGGRPRGSVNNDMLKLSIQDQCRIKLRTLITEGDEDKSSGWSSRGSDDDGDEDDESSQDGGGDDDSVGGSDGDADDDDGGSDISGGGDDETDGEDDGTDDKDDGGGSGKGTVRV
ncbi:hypothetical protein L7F22_067119 [Adiantum nelumboides]|nr:hypothetical protein [Adiantum nelumboides]